MKGIDRLWFELNILYCLIDVNKRCLRICGVLTLVLDITSMAYFVDFQPRAD